jgi:hypothetical protein
MVKWLSHYVPAITQITCTLPNARGKTEDSVKKRSLFPTEYSELTAYSDVMAIKI